MLNTHVVKIADNINGIPRGSTIPPFYVKLIRNYNYLLNDHLFNENSSFYMDISKQYRYERSLKESKHSLNGNKLTVLKWLAHLRFLSPQQNLITCIVK